MACFLQAPFFYARLSSMLLNSPTTSFRAYRCRGSRMCTSAAAERKVVLLSGGVESVMCVHWLQKQKKQSSALVPLFVDYAQKGAQMERKACRTACDKLGLELVEMDASTIGGVFRSRQKARLHVPVPHRNLFILSLAASLASQEKAQAIVLALQQGDTEWYPSAKIDFVQGFDNLLQHLEPNLCLETPLLEYSKSEIIALGHELGVDFADTYSCMRGGEKHCGTCKQCRDRRKSFVEAGFPEPASFYER